MATFVFLFNCFVVVAWNIDLKCQLLHYYSNLYIPLLPQTTYKSLISGIKVINAAINPLLLINAWTSPLNNVTLCPHVYDAARSECCIRSELIDSAFRHLCKDALNSTNNGLIKDVLISWISEFNYTDICSN